MIDPNIWVLSFGVAAFVFLQFASTSRTAKANYTALRGCLSPPQWLFGIVWPVLFVLISTNIILFALRLENYTNSPITYDCVFAVWIANLLLNKFWGVLFNWVFAKPSSGKMFALFVATFLVAGSAIAVLILEAFTDEPWWSIAFLVGPYVAWTTFATVLMSTFIASAGVPDVLEKLRAKNVDDDE